MRLFLSGHTSQYLLAWTGPSMSDKLNTSQLQTQGMQIDPVVQVEMLVHQPLKCPISLESPPLCPQITPCGHVFSFPSIMAHLISHGGDTLRKASPCPLCNAPIVARELRLIRAHMTPPVKVWAPSHPQLQMLWPACCPKEQHPVCFKTEG